MSEKTAEDWRNRAGELRREQRMIEAAAAMDEARALAPADPLIAFLHAQCRYELGHAAADLFGQVVRLWPGNLDALRNHALALASEGRVAEAEALLARALTDNPGWLDGHRVLASLRWTSGQAAGFDASFRVACLAQPGNIALWLGWVGAVAQLRDWPAARAILDEAESHLAGNRQLAIARAFVACEAGDEAARDLLAATADLDDDFLKISRVRFLLRTGDFAGALAIALPMTTGPLAGQMWPYVSTCWRLLGDARAGWLDGEPTYVASLDVGLGASEMVELAEVLRSLHQAQLPYAEQSVRGGTQTDRSVLLRHESILQSTRAALMAAVAEFVAALPAHDAAHPLLSRPRDNLRISGSWSVRLGPGGFNVTHSHPMGWLSSAFYVALPQNEAAPAGHFHLGAPPAELGLNLEPYRTIEPVVGRLVLFPSTMWHGTMPFSAGERLNVAFDVVPG